MLFVIACGMYFIGSYVVLGFMIGRNAPGIVWLVFPFAPIVAPCVVLAGAYYIGKFFVTTLYRGAKGILTR